MNRRVTVLLAALALPMVMASGAQAQEADNCNPVVDGTRDPVRSSSGLVVSNSFAVPCPAAEAPAAAAPAPEMRTEYLVFFDWDRADVTPTADAIIQDAAEAVASGQATRVSVSGFTDTSGPTNYNIGLSNRRAEAVRDRLIAHGVNPAVISTAGFGESNLRVPTPDGVREPQNRRAEIELQ